MGETGDGRPGGRTVNRTSAAQSLAVAVLIAIVPQGIGLRDRTRRNYFAMGRSIDVAAMLWGRGTCWQWDPFRLETIPSLTPDPLRDDAAQMGATSPLTR